MTVRFWARCTFWTCLATIVLVLFWPGVVSICWFTGWSIPTWMHSNTFDVTYYGSIAISTLCLLASAFKVSYPLVIFPERVINKTRS